MADDSLGRQAIERGLFGADGLAESDEIRAPEKYQLVREIGRGGAGVVWLARDRELRRPVAIKFLLEEQSGQLERFRREARFAARLNSPSIVKVYDLGEHEARPFIVMEFIEGTNLKDAELDHRGVIRVVREVAVALQHAHEHGIVHRDIKPENVLIDGNGRAFLTDFGIARDVLQGQGMTLSVAGQIMGTPASMAPEQARGEPHKVDARSDIYSLGATLFFKLTGRWPFEGDNVVDVLHAVIHAPAPFPRSIAPGVPRSIESIVLRCLQKQQDDRYPSARALVEEFDRFLSGSDVAMEHGAWFKRLVRKVTGREEGTPSESATDQDPFWSIGMEVARELAEWDTSVYRISRNLPRTFGRLDAIIERLGDFLESQPLAAWARFYRGMALARRGRLAEALEEMEQAINRVGNLAGAHFELGQLYVTMHLRAQTCARRHLSKMGVDDSLRESRGLLERALVAFAESRALDRGLPEWKTRFAEAVGRMTENDFAGCVAECDSILEEDPDSEHVWKLRGDALRHMGEDPFESYERALEVRRSDYEVCLTIAEVRLERGEVDAARAALDRALEIHPECIEALVLGARTQLAPAGSTEAGLELVERCIALAPDHYEARVTRAELLLQEARLDTDPPRLGGALAELAIARDLDGCGNRVEWLMAQVRLERARHRVSAGERADEDLDWILGRRDEPVVTDVPDPEPWLAVIEQAAALAAEQPPR